MLDSFKVVMMKIQQVLPSIQEPNQLLQVANQLVYHQRNRIHQVHQRAFQRRSTIIHIR